MQRDNRLSSPLSPPSGVTSTPTYQVSVRETRVRTSMRSSKIREGKQWERHAQRARERDVQEQRLDIQDLSVPCMSERCLRCSGRRRRRLEETPGSHMRTGALVAKKSKFLLPRPRHSRWHRRAERRHIPLLRQACWFGAPTPRRRHLRPRSPFGELFDKNEDSVRENTRAYYQQQIKLVHEYTTLSCLHFEGTGLTGSTSSSETRASKCACPS